jgi:hypothetical protein
MMACQFLGGRYPAARRWHALRCAECRTARAADAVLARGIDRLNAEPAPAAAIARTLAQLGVAPAAGAPRSRRWTARVRRHFWPATTAMTALGAICYLRYIDVDPNISVPIPAMPSPNAYNLLKSAAAAMPNNERTVVVGGVTYGNFSRSKVGFALSNKPEVTKDTVPEAHYSSEGERLAHHVFTIYEKSALVQQNAEALKLLRRALRFHYQAPPIRSFRTTMPYLSDYRQLARILALDAQVKAARGDAAGAMDSSLDAMELGAKVGHGNGLIGRLVGVACDAIGRTPVWELAGRLDASHARAAARRIEGLEADREAFADMLREEKWSAVARLREFFVNRNWRTDMSVFSSESGSSPQLKAATYLFLLPYSKRRILDDYIAMMDYNVFEAEKPYRADAHPDALAEALASRDPMVAMLYPSYEPSRFHETAGPIAQDALLSATLALRAYKLEHGGYPERLQDLVPRYLTAVPSDPFDFGQPLRYRRSVSQAWKKAADHAAYTLYSVGPDRKDDGGKPIENALTASQKADRSVHPDAVRQALHAVTRESRGDIVAGVNCIAR